METYTSDDALTAMGFGKFQALVLVYAGTAWLADSMELMLLSFVGPLVRHAPGSLLLGLYFPQIWKKVVLSRLSWRWLLAFTALPCFVLLLFFVIAPESPRYLCVQNRISDATLVLEGMSKTNRVALPPGALTYHTETQLVDHNGPLASQNGHLPVRMDNAMAMSSKSGSGGIASLRKLFSRKLLRSTLLIWFVWFANSFAYYGLVLLKSQLSHANRRCTSAQKSSEAHQKNSNLYKDVFITSLAGVGIAAAIGKIGGIVCPLIAVGMLRSCHQMEAVLVFQLVLGLAGVACILFPVETKGREMK